MGHHEVRLGTTNHWRSRLTAVMDTMRELSSHTDPDAMVRSYAARMEHLQHRDRMITLSRRGHEYPDVRVTRDTQHPRDINPWTQSNRLPIVRGGLLAELAYQDEPRIIDDLDVPPDDPGAEYFEDQRSLMAIPLFDQGDAINWVVFLRRDRGAFRPEDLPEQVWMSNLFGRAIHALVLKEELRRAYDQVDLELKAVADIQRSLLPPELPQIPGVELATYFEASRRASGDYYDLFPLSHGRWGIMMADVSGHGTPAAVLMAITYALAHTCPEPPEPPGRVLARLNRQLLAHYTRESGSFVTAFYGVLDPERYTLTYASAGHNPPRLKRCVDQSLLVLEAVGGLPLGVRDDETYEEASLRLTGGDQIVFYTDGITEAFNAQREMFGTDGLDAVLSECRETAQGLIDAVLEAVKQFAAGHPADDDRTLLVVRMQ